MKVCFKVCSALGSPANAFADDPCDGLLATLDRPTVADSACVVKADKFLAELGFQDALVNDRLWRNADRLQLAGIGRRRRGLLSEIRSKRTFVLRLLAIQVVGGDVTLR